MKKIITAICLLMVMMIGGCTQNNGYIGPIFGSWALMEVSADGVPLEIEKETVFSFQNEVVRVTQVDYDPFAVEVKYGNFSISDDVLSLTFLTHLGPNGEGYGFMMPHWLYFPKNMMPLRFDIKELKGSKMVLVINDGSRELTYSFKKTW